VSALQDVNGDGRDDFLVGTRAAGVEGRLVLASGADGSRIWTFDRGSTPHFNWFAQVLETIEDLNGDGIREAVTSEPGATDGAIMVISGLDGALLLEHIRAGESRGWDLSILADLDADGISDLLVGSPEATDSIARVEAISTITGQRLFEITKDARSWFGLEAEVIGDVDADGHEERLARDAYWSAYLISGKTLSTMFKFNDRGYLEGGIDFDEDGFGDFLFGNPWDSTGGDEAGIVEIYSAATHPRVTSVDPPRAHYRGGESVTLNGKYFTSAANLTVDFDGIPATDLVVIDDAQATCTVPAHDTGPSVVQAANDHGPGRMEDGFVFTPGLLLEGDHRPGGDLLLRYWVDAGDDVYAIYGLPPAVSEATPPFDGTLEIDPFLTLFLFPNWITDEFRFAATIPDDPALSGLEILFQGLAGPQLLGTPKDGAWTNSVSMVIE
jgi:hypothetical protein